MSGSEPVEKSRYINVPVSFNRQVDADSPDELLRRCLFEGLVALYRHREEEWVDSRFYGYFIQREHLDVTIQVGFTEVDVYDHVPGLLRIPEEIVQECRNLLTGKRVDGQPLTSSSLT